jgi:hypothetical protein
VGLGRRGHELLLRGVAKKDERGLRKPVVPNDHHFEFGPMKNSEREYILTCTIVLR